MAKQDTKSAPKKGATRSKKKSHKSVPSGIAHVNATFNNTIVSITDLVGNVIAWASAGKVNFSGSRKSSAFAALLAEDDVIRPLQM